MTKSAYFSDAMRVAQRSFASWHRDPAAPSFGCFDREYWGWKKKDLADCSLQYAVTLCIRYAEHRNETACLPDFLGGYVDFLARVQHADGSFDQSYCYEKAPGAVHNVLSALFAVRRSSYLSSDCRKLLEQVTRKAVAFTLQADETHGDIANHYAHYAFELIQAGKELDWPEATKRGRQYLDRTLALMNPAEGWLNEYDGADPGYQTRVIAYLTRIAALTGEERLWEASAKAARFIETLLMPDNSLHPMLGVRSTALIYPSGFERLAAHDGTFAGLADRVHAAWETGTALLPSMIDLENGIRIAEDAFDAADLRVERGGGAPAEPAPLRAFDLAEAGLHAHLVPGGIAYIGSKLGGVVVLYGHDRLIAEDSGYLLKAGNGKLRWLVRRSGGGRIVESGERHMVIEASFVQSLHEDLSPPQMLLLRALNLTILRFQFVGDLFRKLVVRRLISGRRASGLVLRRKISWQNKLILEDRILANTGFRLPEGAKLFRCRRVTGNHMASSRYFTPSEVAGTPWLEEMAPSAFSGSPIVRVMEVP
jgi:hypothetical protein